MTELRVIDYLKLKKNYDFLEYQNKELENENKNIKKQFEQLLKKLLDFKILKSWQYNGGYSYEFAADSNTDYYKKLYEETKKELDDGRRRWAYYETRFVKCSTCTDKDKEKCLMFSENLCEGERCETLIDLENLLNQAAEKNNIN